MVHLLSQFRFQVLKNKTITRSDPAYYQNIPRLQYDAQAAAFFHIFT